MIVINLSVAFKGIGNSSNKLVSTLNGDKVFLTNSYGGLQRDIAEIRQNYNVVYMFGLDKKLKGTIRIERSAIRDNEIISSELDIDAFVRALNDTGIIAKIGTHPRQSLCNDAYWQKLSKMNCVNDRELDEYIDRVIGTMSEDQLSELEQSPYPYVVKIQGKVKELIAQHRSSVFDTWLEQDKISCLPNYALPAVISPTAFTSMVPKSLYIAEEDMNEYEFKVVWALSELGNVKWWHRNISRLGFQINGPVHAYPDIIVMLHSGKILMVETKGDHLDNDESKEKAKIGDQWAKLAGKQYKYYMVFETKQPDYPGAYSLERFMEIVKEL